MKDLLSVACYSFRGPDRLACLLQSVRVVDQNIAIVVAEDRSDDAMASQYKRTCDEFNARHVRLEEHGHMSVANHRAVMECSTPWVLVCSDDVMIPRDLIAALDRFLESNLMRERVWTNGILQNSFVHQIAGIFLHHWDRADIIDMSRRGVIPELADFQEKDFFAGGGDWFWKHLDGRLPYGDWSEPSPPDKLAVVSNVHGSAFVANRCWWEKVGGCAGVDCWQNDSVASFRIGQWTDAMIVRLPFLPSIPHMGGAAPTPSDPTNRWKHSTANLAREHGFHHRSTPGWIMSDERGSLLMTDGKSNGREVTQFELIEYSLKLRSDSLQRRYSGVIDELDYSYRDFVLP